MRPYGYATNQRTRVIDEEIERGDAAADEILKPDATLSSLVAEWNVRGYTTVTGRPWTEAAMRRMLLNPANAGLLEDGSPAPWPAMFTPDKQGRVREKLEDPARRTGGDLDGRVYLLTGDARAVCALCQTPLISNPSAPGVRSYVCSTKPRAGGCGRIRVQADPLENCVGTHVCARISADMDGPGTILRAHEKLRSDAIRARSQADTAKDAVKAMAGEFAVGGVTKDAYLEVMGHAERLASEAVELERLAAVDLPHTVDDIADWWNHAKMEDRRVLVDIFIERIQISPAVVRGSRVFDEGRVTIEWR